MIKFKVEHLERNAETGGVVSAIWIAVDDNRVIKTGKHVFLQKDPAEDGFIPFESLTEEIVLGWLDADLGFESILQEITLTQPQIQSSNLIAGIPWASN